ncbi:hypothetical protein CYCD_26770 [Tenuifilaceae bacterium CYCD]|nr:hypothetical protein CYCD_26770 [Tenuifilaceae bacterium CYCD]
MTLRELKYVIVGEDRLSHKLNGVARTGYNVGNSLKFQSDRLAEYRQGFKSLANEIPGVSTGLSMLANPFVLGGAALVGLGVGLKRATDEAQKFNSNFRELQNLNLDKTYGQLNGLKRLVRDTAFNKGFEQNLTSRAFYDVQSVTGKYGGEVAAIVELQGEFANLMKADFNSWIEGTGKAMANYGFGVEKLKEFNKSAFATVKVGSITFDQLAKVQSAYAGAAASAGQSFDSANKMLTVFTLKTKSADEAATLTKSLFNDFTKKTTRDALAKIGIDLYDSNNKIKQADRLMLELNAKFRQLGKSDKNVVALKNQFTGSEGLISFVQAATDQTGGLIRTLNDFDSSELGLNKALAIARRDTDYINEQLRNRTKIILSEIGDNFLPLKNEMLDWVNSILIIDQARRVGVKESFTLKGNLDATRNWGHLINGAASMSPEKYKEELAKLKTQMQDVDKLLKEYAPYENSKIHPVNKALANYYKSYAANLVDIYSLSKYNRERGISPNIPGLGGENDQNKEQQLKNGIDSISGGGNAVRNITVNIGKLIETQEINTQTIKESMPEIQRLVEDAIIRAVAGTEQMMAN